MDPKALSHLDPKMKETYERVMGTAATPSTNASPSPSNLSDNLPADTAGGQPLIATPTTEAQGQAAEPYNANHSGTPEESSVTPSSFQESPFFSNSNPSNEDASQDLASNLGNSENDFTPGEPVTPYSDTTQNPNAPLSPVTPDAGPATSSFSQPLQPPADLNQNSGPHEASALLRVLYIVGAVVFFMIYTIFWIKVFNLPFIF